MRRAEDKAAHRLRLGNRAAERLGLGRGRVHDDLAQRVDALHLARVVLEDDLRLVGKLPGHRPQMVRELGASLVGPEDQHAHLVIAHPAERLDEDLLPLPARQASRNRDDGEVGGETELQRLLRKRVLRIDGVGTEDVRIRAAVDADHLRGIDGVCREDVVLHVVRHGDRPLALEHHAVVGNLEPLRRGAVDAVEGRHPLHAAPFRCPFHRPGRRPAADVHQRHPLGLAVRGEFLRTATEDERVLAVHRQRQVRHPERLELTDHRTARAADGIGNPGRRQGPRDFNRAALDTALLQGRKDLKDFHGEVVVELTG